MTTEQLAELRKMTKWEITKKYLPYLNRGEITREVYDFLLSKGREPEPQKEIEVSEFTTHDDEVLGRTQTKRLANLLSDGEWHPNTEILEKVAGAGHSGRLNIPARKYDLIKAGYEIEYVHKHGSVWEMRMVRAPAAENIESNVSDVAREPL